MQFLVPQTERLYLEMYLNIFVLDKSQSTLTNEKKEKKKSACDLPVPKCWLLKNTKKAFFFCKHNKLPLQVTFFKLILYYSKNIEY